MLRVTSKHQMNKFLILLGLIVFGFILIRVFSPIDAEIIASRVISDCWDEELKICKNENKGDACTFGVYQSCGVKYPEEQKIFDKRSNECWEKHAYVEKQQQCIYGNR